MSGHDDLSNVIAGVVSLIASFSIVHIAGTRDISNNLTVTAIPRTRIGGGMARRQGIANGRDHPELRNGRAQREHRRPDDRDLEPELSLHRNATNDGFRIAAGLDLRRPVSAPPRSGRGFPAAATV
jgi:hypothetical protein